MEEYDENECCVISDVVELYNASGSTFFYIDRYGFQPIEFVDHPSQDQSMSMTL